MKTALICGISGQDGSYLAKLLLEKHYRVVGTSRDAQTATFKNLCTLGIRDEVETHSMTLTDFRSVLQTLQQYEPDEIYSLAGQTSVGLSFDQPVETFESITVGTINLLEALRFTQMPARLYNAGSGECFGNTDGQPANEQTAFRPRSPYATAKAGACWAVANYREAYDLFACTGILFNHESPFRPFRFVTRKIVSTACAISRGEARELKLGNMQISRDWGWAPEYVDAMWRMLQQEQADDFVIATGESHTLEAFCDETFKTLSLDYREFVRAEQSLLRPIDVETSCGDASKARDILEWQGGQ